MNVFANKPLLTVALFALGGSLFAAEPNAAKEAAKKETAKREAEAKSSQQSMMEQFKAQAESFSKDHDALMKKLNAANAEERKAILEKMEERKKEFETRLAALHKEMRDEQRKQRSKK